MVAGLVVLVAAAHAARGGEPTPDRARAELLEASRQYRASLDRLLAFKSREVEQATALLEARRDQLARGLVARRDVEEAERALAGARAKGEETRREIADADRAVAEALAAPRLAMGELRATGEIIGYRGPAKWSLPDSARLDRFFRERFGLALPVSAYGQSFVHDRLGLDHRDALDIALHPDSREGAALLAFLKTAGIPFLAFRGPVAGAATGAHIHVGAPSQRVDARLRR